MATRNVIESRSNRLRLLMVLFIVLAVLSIGIGVFGFFYSAKDFTVNSPQRLVEAINHSATTKQSYNYIVTKSFDIDVADLPTGKPFYGQLKGNCNTITIKSKDGRPMTSPIFGRIQRGASVERLTFNVNTTLGEDDNVSDMAVLANDNFGAVKDCSFSINKIFIGSKCQNSSAIVNNNFGEINSVCVSVEDVSSSQTTENWRCNFGTIATSNYAIVKNVFIKVLFNDIDIFNNSFNNQRVGYIFSKIGNDMKKTDVDSVYLFGSGLFYDLCVDAARLDANETVKGEKPNSSLITDFIHYNGKYDGKVSPAWSASKVDDKTGFPILSK